MVTTILAVCSYATVSFAAGALTASDDAYLMAAFKYSEAELKNLHQKSLSCQALIDAAINDPQTMYVASARYDEVAAALATVQKHPGNDQSCSPESENPTN